MKSSAVGAVGAQGVQALASFALQILVARTLGFSGLGVFAVLYGVVVLASATTTGFVGDSLVVQPRRERAVRSALEQYALLVAGGAGVIAGAVTTSIGLTTPFEGLLFTLAIVAFCLEEVVRRTLMADLLFWRVSLIDAAGLAVALAIVGVATLVGRATLPTFLGALAVGQTAALLLGCVVVPARERYLVAFVGGARLTVAAYGIWRSLQQFLRPALLTTVRSLVSITVGFAATGLLEAARVYVAPALLLVSGLSSYLFASFAQQRDRPISESLHRSDRAVAALVAVTVGIGAIAVIALPLAGPVLFSSAPDLTAVLGWLAFTASVAAVTPYGALAAVSGRQTVVFAVRVGDTLISLLAVAIALPLGVPSAWAPVLMSVGSLAGGILIRELVRRTSMPAEGVSQLVPRSAPSDGQGRRAPARGTRPVRWTVIALAVLIAAAVAIVTVVHGWSDQSAAPTRSPSVTRAASALDLQHLVNAAPTDAAIRLQARTYSLRDFDPRSGAELDGHAIWGAGAGRTTIEMPPRQSTKATSVPTSTGSTNPLYLLSAMGGTPRLSGFSLIATDQRHLYGGLFVGRATNAHVSDVTIRNVPGADSEPPGETFALNDFRCNGSVYTGITIDGGGLSAADFGTNSSTDVTINDSTFTGTAHSSGAALWQTRNIAFNDVQVVDNRSGMNFERDSGEITLMRPTFRNNARYDMQFGTDQESAHVNIVDPTLAAGQKIRMNVPTNYHGVPNGQLRGDIHVFVDGVDMTAELVQFL